MLFLGWNFFKQNSNFTEARYSDDTSAMAGAKHGLDRYLDQIFPSLLIYACHRNLLCLRFIRKAVIRINWYNEHHISTICTEHQAWDIATKSVYWLHVRPQDWVCGITGLSHDDGSRRAGGYICIYEMGNTMTVWSLGSRF